MKVVAVFALACIAAAYSAPAVKAVDWTAVADKARELEAIVRGTVQAIKDIANADNEAIGSDIAAQLDAAIVKVEVVLAAAADQIRDESLTAAQAEAYFTELKDIFAGVQADLQDELAQLSEAAASHIREVFNSGMADAEAIAQEIYALLREEKRSTLAVDWSAVGAKVGEVEALVRDSVQRVKDIANADNEAVGSDIAAQLDAATEKAKVVLAAAAAQIDDQTLTEEQAKAYFTELKEILAGVQDDLQDELDQLSSNAATQIRDIFYAAYANAETIAQEIYALLRE